MQLARVVRLHAIAMHRLLGDSVVHDWLLIPRGQSHAAVRDVAHELGLFLGRAHAHASLCFPQTVLVVEITIGSAAPRCLSGLLVAYDDDDETCGGQSATYHVQSDEGVELDEAVEVAEHDRQRQV